jgi:monoamine oxidase
MRGTTVLIAGAGLAGLTAARDLARKGAFVTVIDARDRVGGRVLTIREPFRFRQHAEAGADLIDESQTEICKLIREMGLRLAEILPGGFSPVQPHASGLRVGRKAGWRHVQQRLQPEIRAFCLGEQRWDGGIADALGRQSVAQWLDRVAAAKPLRQVALGLRGFFLADPDQLSLLSLVDQFAENGVPGGEKMFRIAGGNDRLAERLAKPLRRSIELNTILRRVRQSADGLTASIEAHGRVRELRADYLLCAVPAMTLRDVVFEPGMPETQRQAVTTVKYGAATKTALQFRDALWRKTGKPRAFGTPLPIGAVWDGNEEQRGRAGILTLLAGGRASASTRAMLADGGPSRLIREMTWLHLKKTGLIGWTSTSWEHDQWARGGYAFFDPEFPPSIRAWLARPFGRVFFAGEHTSFRWQGYMNGAVETGLRAAAEVAALARAQD